MVWVWGRFTCWLVNIFSILGWWKTTKKRSKNGESRGDLDGTCFLIFQKCCVSISPPKKIEHIPWIPSKNAWKTIYWVVVSNSFYFHPYLGKWSNLTNIFQVGWNHQPVYVPFEMVSFQLTFVHLLWGTLPKTNTSPLKMTGTQEETIVFQPSIFRWHWIFWFWGGRY